MGPTLWRRSQHQAEARAEATPERTGSVSAASRPRVRGQNQFAERVAARSRRSYRGWSSQVGFADLPGRACATLSLPDDHLRSVPVLHSLQVTRLGRSAKNLPMADVYENASELDDELNVRANPPEQISAEKGRFFDPTC